MFTIVRRALIMVALVSVLMTACGKDKQDKPKSDAAASQSSAPSSVKLVANFPNMSFGGIYAAQKEGYFEDEHLDFEPSYLVLTPDLTNQDTVSRVVAGEGDFGVARADQLLAARDSGQPLVAIMTIFQRDPLGVISLSTEGISVPRDLAGKKILVWDSEMAFKTFAVQVGLDLDQVTLIATDDMNLDTARGLFLTGEVDAAAISIPEFDIALTKMGIAHNALYFYEYGVAMYPNVIFTTEAMIQDHPETVQHFVNAVLKGTEYAIEHALEIGTWFEASYAGSLRPAQVGSQGEVMQANIALLKLPDTPIGMMNAETWAAIHAGMVANGTAQAGDVSQAYTLQFLDTYYH